MKYTFLFLSFLILFSCSIQKRKYQRGFYVARIHQQSHNQKASAISVAPNPGDEIKRRLRLETIEVPLIASADPAIGARLEQINLPLIVPPPDSCDIITFTDGSQMEVKIFELSDSDVKYKRCGKPEGPSYVTLKSDLFMIKFANGSKEVMKGAEVPKKKEVLMPEKIEEKSEEREISTPAVTNKMASVSWISAIVALISFIMAIVILVASVSIVGFESDFTNALLVASGLLIIVAPIVGLISGLIAKKEIYGDVDKYTEISKRRAGKGLKWSILILTTLLLILLGF